MRDIPELIDGYRRFLAGRYQEEAALYRSLANAGQAPKTMIISCCDSRVDPAAIFSAGPGELFIVRNVANVAPPCEPEGGYHGTSAAIEFAVTGLGVENIVVMGHGRCGGVRAFLERPEARSVEHGFIAAWMSLLEPAWEAVRADTEDKPIETRCHALERANVRQSVENLKTFPFIHKALEGGRLKLRGAFFDIADGKLLTLDAETGRFEVVE